MIYLNRNKGKKMKNILMILLTVLLLPITESFSSTLKLNMVFVPASEKGDDQDYTNLINIINKITGYVINPIRVTDYNAAVESMRADRAHIAWFGGKTYIVANRIANAEAFAAGIRKGDTSATYLTYFVVRRDSQYKKLIDLKGKILALNSIGSTSGDLIPQVEIKKNGLSIKKHFVKVFYAGSHDACLMAVINKHADVCGMSSRNYDARLTDKTFNKSQVRIIHKSSPVPPPPLAYSKKLSKKVRDNIKSAVLEAHKYGKIGGYGGEMERYISVVDKDYDALRDVEKLLNQN